MLYDRVEVTLRRAFSIANCRKHASVTLEHLLLSLTEDPDAVKAFQACGVNLNGLRDDLTDFLDNGLIKHTDGLSIEGRPNEDFQRTIQRAADHAQSLNRPFDGLDTLLALLSENSSEAVKLLNSHNLSEENVFNTYLHGISKPCGNIDAADAAGIGVTRDLSAQDIGSRLEVSLEDLKDSTPAKTLSRDGDHSLIDSTLPTLCVVQRCRHYMLWPEHFSVESQPFSIPNLKAASFRGARFRLGLRSYQNRPDYSKPAEQLSGDVFLFINLQRSVGFSFGDSIFVDGPGTTVARPELLGPVQGEAEFYLAVECEQLLDPDEVCEVLSPYMASWVSYVGFVTRDFLVTTSPVFGVKREGNEFTLSKGVGYKPVQLPRVEVPSSNFDWAANNFSRHLINMSAEDRLTINKAAERVESAKKELDIIDRYCDYWEACEFLTKAPGSKAPNRIAKRLSDITHFNKKTLEDRIVSPLYRIRGDIVHNAIENSDRLDRAIPILESMATLLLGSSFGGTFLKQGPLAEYYEATVKGTASPI